MAGLAKIVYRGAKRMAFSAWERRSCTMMLNGEPCAMSDERQGWIGSHGTLHETRMVGLADPARGYLPDFSIDDLAT